MPSELRDAVHTTVQSAAQMGLPWKEIWISNKDGFHNGVHPARGRPLADQTLFDKMRHGHNSSFRNRSALPITDTELRLIAAAAIIGLSSRPKNG